MEKKLNKNRTWPQKHLKLLVRRILFYLILKNDRIMINLEKKDLIWVNPVEAKISISNNLVVSDNRKAALISRLDKQTKFSSNSLEAEILLEVFLMMVLTMGLAFRKWEAWEPDSSNHRAEDRDSRMMFLEISVALA